MTEKKELVILLEPDEAVRSAISSLLKQHGWQIEARGTAGDLDAAFREHAPVALICESTLPGITSRQVLEVGNDNSVPVIFLGHRREIQEAVDLIHLGARDYMEKPFPQDRLLRILNSLTEEISS